MSVFTHPLLIHSDGTQDHAATGVMCCPLTYTQMYFTWFKCAHPYFIVFIQTDMFLHWMSHSVCCVFMFCLSLVTSPLLFLFARWNEGISLGDDGWTLADEVNKRTELPGITQVINGIMAWKYVFILCCYSPGKHRHLNLLPAKED